MTPTLLLLPGMDGTGRLFGRFRASLGDRYPVTPVAYPGERRVPRSDLLGRIDAALPRDGDHVLVAESFSGPLAIEHAVRRPEGLRGLVLVASFAASPLPGGLRWLRHVAGVARFRPPDLLVRLLLVGRDASGELVREVKAAIDSVEREVLVDRLRQVLEVDVRDRLASLAVPVLYLRGNADRLVGSRGLAQCARHVPRLTAERIDGPHLLLQARPRESAEAVGRFLRGVE